MPDGDFSMFSDEGDSHVQNMVNDMRRLITIGRLNEEDAYKSLSERLRTISKTRVAGVAKGAHEVREGCHTEVYDFVVLEKICDALDESWVTAYGDEMQIHRLAER
jgi:hypothetical protein